MIVMCTCEGLSKADVYAKYGKCCKEILRDQESLAMARMQVRLEMLHGADKNNATA